MTSPQDDRTSGPLPFRRVTDHPVTGVPQELRTEQLRTVHSDAPEAEVARARDLLRDFDCGPENFQRAVAALERLSYLPEAVSALKHCLALSSDHVSFSNQAEQASRQKACAQAIFRSVKNGAEHLLDAAEDTNASVRDAVLSAFLGSADPRLRSRLVEGLTDESGRVRVAAAGSLLALDFRTEKISSATDFSATLTTKEAIALAKYAMKALTQDLRPPGEVDPHFRRGLAHAAQDFIFGHPDPEVEGFIISAARGEQEPEITAGACSILARQDSASALKIVEWSYRRNSGGMRAAFLLDGDHGVLATNPNPGLELAIVETIEAPQTSPSNRTAALKLLLAGRPEVYHSRICKLLQQAGQEGLFYSRIGEYLVKHPSQEGMQAACAVLASSPRLPLVFSLLRESGIKLPNFLTPEKSMPGNENPQQSAAVAVLSSGEHPLKENALVHALRSKSGDVRWEAAAALGTNHRLVVPAISSINRRELTQLISAALHDPSRKHDGIIAAMESDIVLPILKDRLKGATRPDEFRRLGDLFAARINNACEGSLSVLIDYLEQMEEPHGRRHAHLPLIIDKTVLHALDQVEELFEDELAALELVFGGAPFNADQRTFADQIIAKLRNHEDRVVAGLPDDGDELEEEEDDD